MTANHELERRLADFYASEAPLRAPERVLESVLAASEITRQRRAVIRAPWRFHRMTTAAKLAVAAILLIAAGAIGFALVGNRPPVPFPFPFPFPFPVWCRGRPTGWIRIGLRRSGPSRREAHRS